MNKFCVLILSVVIAACFHPIAYAGEPGMDYDESPLAEPVNWAADVSSNPAMLIALNSGMNDDTSIYHFDAISESSPGRISDGLDLRGGPLFITGPITGGRSSVPESSMMLLLGIGLIGLAGYGGRKKFRR
ncbi:MAG: PEP-CTERM sorting domain-containing protein [Desulfobacterales bacterium]|jgi:hypothetical protein|nr:PEP-CTERM sorting domain-containing protein [Desulfobacterales bacterium]